VDAALQKIADLCRGPIALDAVDVEPDGPLAIRLGGDPEILGARSERLERKVGAAGEVLSGADDRAYWDAAAAFTWVPPGHTIVRSAVSPSLVRDLTGVLSEAGAMVRYSLAANVAWIGWPAGHPIDELAGSLARLDLSGMALTGPSLPGLLGAGSGGAFGERVRFAFDPFRRFLED
jgi:hypothetical protein